VTASAPFHLLTNAEVFAPEPLGRCSVLVAGERVLYVGKEGPALGGLDVTEHDCGGRRLVPGLVDAHVHVTGAAARQGPTPRRGPCFAR